MKLPDSIVDAVVMSQTRRGFARPWMLPALALVLWATWLSRCARILIDFGTRVPRIDVWLYDWNVYHAAAVDLIDRMLYRVALVQPGYELPISVFNYPPLAAVWAVPLLPFGREPGGVIWLVLGLLATSVGALLGARALRLPWKWAWVAAGAGLAVYGFNQLIGADIALGNNNHLMFALVAGFALAHVYGHQRVAGVLLALAIGTKLWPIALVVLLLRERRWSELRWTVGALVVQGVVGLAWLGPDVIGPMVSAVLDANLSREPGVAAVMWTTWARYTWDWWPAWGGYAVAGALLLIPATGRLGLGLGIIAGLSLNANLWHHYAPVFVLGVALAVAGALSRLGPERFQGKTRRRYYGQPVASAGPMLGKQEYDERERTD